MNVKNMRILVTLVAFSGVLCGAAALKEQSTAETNQGETITGHIQAGCLDIVGLEELPEEILAQIVEFLEPASLAQMPQVNRKLQSLITSMPLYKIAKEYKGNLQAMLFSTVENNYVGAINYVRRHGLDINIADKEGVTALMIALMGSSKKSIAGSRNNLVRQLIINGADVNLANKYGKTTLMIAADADGDDSDLINLLLEARADIDVAMPDGGMTALMFAVRKKACNNNVGMRLIEARANLEVDNTDGNTPLMIAANGNRKKMVYQLIKAKANVNTVNESMESALTMAAKQGFDDVVEHLIDARADVDTSNDFDETPLMLAASKGYNGVMEYLIQAKANVNKTDRFDNTALQMAMQAGHEQATQLLLDAGAVSDLANDDC